MTQRAQCLTKRPLSFVLCSSEGQVRGIECQVFKDKKQQRWKQKEKKENQR